MKKDITILGIHNGHNAGAALIKNGSVVAAIQDERLNNIKNYGGTPINAVRVIFGYSNPILAFPVQLVYGSQESQDRDEHLLIM
jgi:carbamoyltransferase